MKNHSYLAHIVDGRKFCRVNEERLDESRSCWSSWKQIDTIDLNLSHLGTSYSLTEMTFHTDNRTIGKIYRDILDRIQPYLPEVYFKN